MRMVIYNRASLEGRIINIIEGILQHITTIDDNIWLSCIFPLIPSSTFFSTYTTLCLVNKSFFAKFHPLIPRQIWIESVRNNSCCALCKKHTHSLYPPKVRKHIRNVDSPLYQYRNTNRYRLVLLPSQDCEGSWIFRALKYNITELSVLPIQPRWNTEKIIPIEFHNQFIGCKTAKEPRLAEKLKVLILGKDAANKYVDWECLNIPNLTSLNVALCFSAKPEGNLWKRIVGSLTSNYKTPSKLKELYLNCIEMPTDTPGFVATIADAVNFPDLENIYVPGGNYESEPQLILQMWKSQINHGSKWRLRGYRFGGREHDYFTHEDKILIPFKVTEEGKQERKLIHFQPIDLWYNTLINLPSECSEGLGRFFEDIFIRINTPDDLQHFADTLLHLSKSKIGNISWRMAKGLYFVYEYVSDPKRRPITRHTQLGALSHPSNNLKRLLTEVKKFRFGVFGGSLKPEENSEGSGSITKSQFWKSKPELVELHSLVAIPELIPEEFQLSGNGRATCISYKWFSKVVLQLPITFTTNIKTLIIDGWMLGTNSSESCFHGDECEVVFRYPKGLFRQFPVLEVLRIRDAHFCELCTMSCCLLLHNILINFAEVDNTHNVNPIISTPDPPWPKDRTVTIEFFGEVKAALPSPIIKNRTRILRRKYLENLEIKAKEIEIRLPIEQHIIWNFEGVELTYCTDERHVWPPLALEE
jgi:hypothetical protein